MAKCHTIQCSWLLWNTPGTGASPPKPFRWPFQLDEIVCETLGSPEKVISSSESGGKVAQAPSVGQLARPNHPVRHQILSERPEVVDQGAQPNVPLDLT